MNTLLDFILHLDVHLPLLVEQFGWLSYGILFLIVFCETGLVFTPFLPGDSLLFVAGTLAGQGTLKVLLLWLVLTVAAILGDSVNYWVGTHFGRRLERSKMVRPEYLEKTQGFYEKYGKKTIIIARFIPIVRTFAPFVAGMARMNYRDFLIYNIVGGIAWVSFFIFAGFFFGRITWVQDNLEKVILGIMVLSLVPPILEVWKQHKASKSLDTRS
jgi:membrane-associated protein